MSPFADLKERFAALRRAFLARVAWRRARPAHTGRFCCYLDLAFYEGARAKTIRLVFELRGDVVPKTAENFRVLCTGERGFGYRGCWVRRLEPGVLLQLGKVGRSAYGPPGSYFPDESFALRGEGAGDLRMANQERPNTNRDEFVVLLGSSADESLEDCFVKIGRVVEGLEELRAEAPRCVGFGGAVTERIVVVECGELPRAAGSAGFVGGGRGTDADAVVPPSGVL